MAFGDSSLVVCARRGYIRSWVLYFHSNLVYVQLLHIKSKRSFGAMYVSEVVDSTRLYSWQRIPPYILASEHNLQ